MSLLLLLDPPQSARPSNPPPEIVAFGWDFTSGELPDFASFSRASSKAFVGQTEVLETADIDEPAFFYSGVLCKGLTFEPGSENILRNATMEGAVVGTPGTFPTNWSTAEAYGGISRNIVGTGTIDGHPFLNLRIVGTATTNLDHSSGGWVGMDTTTGIAAQQYETWSTSAFLRVVDGSLDGVSVGFSYRVRNSTGGYLSIPAGDRGSLNTSIAASSESIYSGWVWDSAKFVSSGVGYAVPQIHLTIASGSAVDLTLQVLLPQVERNTFATYPILLGRSADILTFTVPEGVSVVIAKDGDGDSYDVMVSTDTPFPFLGTNTLASITNNTHNALWVSGGLVTINGNAVLQRVA